MAAARLGWRLVWASEIEPFPLSVHARRFPGVRMVGDISAWQPDPVEDAVDIIVGGWPCQDVSVAGLRAGLKGERSGLFFELARIARRLRPRWFLLENVPGLFSSPSDPPGFNGLDFTAVLASLADIGYGVAWRVLDAEFFGVPQRRRRVFLVGRFGAVCPAPVLFEPEGVRGDPAPGGEARARIAAGALSRALSRVGGGDDPGANKGAPIVIAPPLVAGGREMPPHGTGDGTNIVVGTLTGRERGTSPGTDDAAGGRVVVSPPVTHKPNADRGAADEDAIVVSGAVSAKWAKHSGGPAGDEAYNLVVADAIQANEQRLYWNEGQNFRPHNVLVVPPDFEEAEGETDDALRIDGEDQIAADGPGAEADGGPRVEGVEGLADVGPFLARLPRPGAPPEPDGGDGQLVLFPRLPVPLQGAQDEPGLLAREDQAQQGAGSAGGAPAPGDGVPGAGLVAMRAAREVSPTLRQGGRDQGAGSSAGNTPVVLDPMNQKAHAKSTTLRGGDGGETVPAVFEPRVARNGRGAPEPVSPPLKAENGETGKGDGAPIVVGLNQLTSWCNRSNPQPGDPSATLAAEEQMAVFGFKPGYYTRGKDGGPADLIPPLSADADKGDQDPLVFDGRPRRLTPLECERLQGFPDGWTCMCGTVERVLRDAGIPLADWMATDWRLLKLVGLTHACRCKDSARYRALGNAVAVTVVEWIMRRLERVDLGAAA